MKLRFPATAFLLAAVVAATGCTTAQPRYYLMSSVEPAKAPMSATELSLGVGPVQLADYLQRANIVTRESTSRIRVAADHKWGAALDSHFAEVLAEDLRLRLGLRGVQVYPWQPGVQPDIQLTMELTRFIHEGDAVHLDARWRIIDRAARHAAEGFSQISEPASAEYDDIVDAMSRATARLADELSQQLRQQAARK